MIQRINIIIIITIKILLLKQKNSASLRKPAILYVNSLSRNARVKNHQEIIFTDLQVKLIYNRGGRCEPDTDGN